MKIDAIKEMCYKMNTNGNIKGYWWKTYKGGYGGCCKSLDNLASNWPDANTYSLEAPEEDEEKEENAPYKFLKDGYCKNFVGSTRTYNIPTEDKCQDALKGKCTNGNFGHSRVSKQCICCGDKITSYG